MNIITKKFLIIILSLILFGCGYTPLYKNTKNLDFTISISDTIGNREVNNLIKSKLKSYTQSSNVKKFDIKIITDYQKNIIAKDTTGAASEYKIILKAIFQISTSQFNKEIKFEENFNMKSIDDKLEEKDYEQSIKNSLANIISRKLILQLSQVK